MWIFLKTRILVYDNLSKTNICSMWIFLRTKILNYDNLINTIFRSMKNLTKTNFRSTTIFDF